MYKQNSFKSSFKNSFKNSFKSYFKVKPHEFIRFICQNSTSFLERYDL